MTNSCLLLFFTSTLVIFSHSVSVNDCLKPWFKKYIWDATLHGGSIPPTAILFPSDLYLQLIPFCIRNVKRSTAGSCEMNFNHGPINNQNLTPLKEIFVCINEDTNGAQLQKKGATAILWSGKRGKGRAKELHTEHKGKSPWNWSGTKGVYPDTELTVLSNYLLSGGIAGKFADTKAVELGQPQGYEKMLIDVACIWLVFNSHPQAHSNKMHDYASLAAYELHNGQQNQGRGSLLHNGITSGLVLNNYFWTVEVPTIARLFNAIDYTGIQGQTRNSAELVLHLRTYTINPHANTVVDNDWTTHNLFGALGDLANIKVIFEAPGHLQYPVFKGANPDATVTTADLHDLITDFNTGRANVADRITQKLHMDIPKLIQFIHWTEQIPFKNFDVPTHKRGGWVTHTMPQPQPDAKPGPKVAFSRFVEYNEIGDKYRENYRKFHHKKGSKKAAMGTFKHSDDGQAVVPYTPYNNPYGSYYTHTDYLLNNLLMFLFLFIGICIGLACGIVGLCAYCGLKVFDRTQKNYVVDEQNIV